MSSVPPRGTSQKLNRVAEQGHTHTLDKAAANATQVVQVEVEEEEQRVQRE